MTIAPLETFNRTLFLMINGTSDTPTWLVHTALFCANYLIFVVPVLLAGLWLSGSLRFRRIAVRAFMVSMVALGANQIIGAVWWHPRPFMIGLGHTYLQHAPDSSFPSDHVTVLASVAVTLLLRRLWSVGAATLVAGLVVAWARVFVGVHFPLDMAGAAGVACVSYALLAPLWNAGGRWVTDQTVAIYRTALAAPIRRRWLRA